MRGRRWDEDRRTKGGGQGSRVEGQGMRHQRTEDVNTRNEGEARDEGKRTNGGETRGEGKRTNEGEPTGEGRGTNEGETREERRGTND